jgi:hypothetical protein
MSEHYRDDEREHRPCQSIREARYQLYPGHIHWVI